MPVMGFDDERGRDAWRAEMAARRAARSAWEDLLREVLQEIELREVERVDTLAAFEEWRRAAEAWRPLMQALGEALLPLVERVTALWEALDGLGEEGRIRTDVDEVDEVV